MKELFPHKLRAYMKVAKTKRGYKVEANSKPDYVPFEVGNNMIPTLFFAIDFDIDDELFAQAERVIANINLEMKDSKIGAKILIPAVKKAINEESLKSLKS